MAKRKARRPKGRKTTSTSARVTLSRARARKLAARRATTRKPSARQAGVLARKAVRKASKRRAVTTTTRKAATRKQTRPTVVRRRAPVVRKPVTPHMVHARKVPALHRERKIVPDEDLLLPRLPSSLNPDRFTQTERTRPNELRDRSDQHNETNQILTEGGIGTGISGQHEDSEELKGNKATLDRDQNHCELHPASSEDYEDR